VARVVWNEPEVNFLLKSPIGAVGRSVQKRAFRVQTAAKRQVGVKSGKLQESIKYTVSTAPYGVKATVGSSVNYALIHHNGSRPHVILPVRAKSLVFTSRGRLVVTNRVNHPGTKPNRYLTDNLRLALINT
jgi:phage gpG-like protein